MSDNEARARELVNVGCSCSEENAERCRFSISDGIFGFYCIKQRESIAAALSAAEARGRDALKAERDAAIMEAKDEAIVLVFDRLAKALGLAQWVISDGTDTWGGDVEATLFRLLGDSGAIDPETNVPAARERDALKARVAKLVTGLPECGACNGSGADKRGGDCGACAGMGIPPIYRASPGWLREALRTAEAERDALRAKLAVAEKALGWYALNAEGCRKLGRLGDEFRQALDRDGGRKARDALAAIQPTQGEAT